MKRIVSVATILVALFLLTSLALASHGGSHLDWWTVDGGGVSTVESGDGSYTLSGTAGQPDAGMLTSGDGSYTLAGGFWAGETESASAPPPQNTVYLPIAIRE